MAKERETQPEESFEIAEKQPAAASAGPLNRRKTTSRRTKTVLDEIAEQENRLRKETQRIAVDGAAAKEPASNPLRNHLDAEYKTLQEKLDAIEKFAASENTSLGLSRTAASAAPADSADSKNIPEAVRAHVETMQPPPAGEQAAQETEDFLKQRFFAILNEGVQEELGAAGIAAEQLMAGAGAVGPETFEETAASADLTTADATAEAMPTEQATVSAPWERDTAEDELIEAAAQFSASQQGGATVKLAGREAVAKPSKESGEGDAEKPTEIVAFDVSNYTAEDVEGRPASGMGTLKDKDVVLAQEAGTHRRGRLSRAADNIAVEQMRTTPWEALGYFCIGLAALVIILWCFLLLLQG
jgi:hypothetical protein